jgi:hypothetical protein
MRYHRMPVAEPRIGDPEEMREAIERLKKEGWEPRRPLGEKNYQLKLSPRLSYYPTTGRIVFDNETALPDRGLEALIGLLRASTKTR